MHELVAEFGFITHICRRCEKVKKMKQGAGFRIRRGVAEYMHNCVSRPRGLAIRCAKQPESYLAVLHITCGIIAGVQLTYWDTF